METNNLLTIQLDETKLDEQLHAFLDAIRDIKEITLKDILSLQKLEKSLLADQYYEQAESVRKVWQEHTAKKNEACNEVGFKWNYNK